MSRCWYSIFKCPVIGTFTLLVVTILSPYFLFQLLIPDLIFFSLKSYQVLSFVLWCKEPKFSTVFFLYRVVRVTSGGKHVLQLHPKNWERDETREQIGETERGVTIDMGVLLDKGQYEWAKLDAPARTVSHPLTSNHKYSWVFESSI